MKSKYLKYTVFIITFLLFTEQLLGQVDELRLEYVYFDDIVGEENTSLYQGILHLEKYRTINENKQFFKSSKFYNGTIWYEGQPYFNQKIKYDVFEDGLLLKLKEEVGGGILKVVKANVDSFKIDEHNFINIGLSNSSDDVQPGFYEVIFESVTASLCVKHNKNIIKKKNEKFGYYEFVDAPKTYVLFYEDMYYKLNSKKSVLRLFPQHELQINEYYKKSRKTLNKNKDLFMIELMRKIKSIY